MGERVTENEAGGTPPALRLNTVGNTRRSLARLIRERARGTLDDADFRALVWALNVLIGAFKAEYDLETVAARLDRLEAVLERQEEGFRDDE